MAIPRTVSLDGSFRSPTVLAQLDLLAVLADAMAPFLPDLSDLVDDWHFVVDEAAHVLATQSPHIQNLSDALAIWDLVLKTLVISRFPPDAKALMDAMTARLYTAVLSPDAGIACLEAAHLRAVTWVQTVGQQRNISVLKQATPIPILVGYDPDGLQFCASSSQLGNQIGWSLQLKRRALYGALIADMFLAHEYLSHMLPRNTHLSWNVREVWLSTALFWERKSQPGDAAQQHVAQFCWEQFRHELNMQFDPNNRKFFGPRQLDGLAEVTYLLSEEIFWDITKTILECSDNAQNAQAINALLKHFMRLSQQQLKKTLELGCAGCAPLRLLYNSLI